jgi:hypothetical protein
VLLLELILIISACTSQNCRQAGWQAAACARHPVSHFLIHLCRPWGLCGLRCRTTELTRKYPQLMSKAMGSHNSILRKVSAALGNII